MKINNVSIIIILLILLTPMINAQVPIINRVGTGNDYNNMIYDLPSEYTEKLYHIEIIPNYYEICSNKTFCQGYCGYYRYTYNNRGKLLKSSITLVDNKACNKKDTLLHEIGHNIEAQSKKDLRNFTLSETYADNWKLQHQEIVSEFHYQ
jgi:hypothetical protein